jgi:glycosyltransferase involved in cell wall biosynthesis
MVCGSKENGVTGLTTGFVRGKRSGVVDGIEVIEYDLQYSNSDSFAKRSWKFLKFALRSIKVALTQKCDVVFSTTTPLTAGIPGIFAKVFRRKPFVFEVRDLWPELPREMGVITNPIVLWMMSMFEWASYKAADRCIGLSPGIVDGIRKRGVDESRIELIPNGCDLDILGIARPKWRPDGVDKDDFMAIFTGAHGVANGLDAVLDAARVLRNIEASHIKLVLVGAGKLKPRLVERAKKENLNNVVFVEPVNKDMIASLMLTADIGMQVLANIPAFYYGTSPNKFFDYIASGLPIINNYPGWLADLITENNCGYVVEPENPDAFARSLLHASLHPEELEKMGTNARQLAERKFDRNKLSDRWTAWVLGAVHK